jgi:hypothetical protein
MIDGEKGGHTVAFAVIICDILDGRGCQPFGPDRRIDDEIKTY